MSGLERGHGGTVAVVAAPARGLDDGKKNNSQPHGLSGHLTQLLPTKPASAGGSISSIRALKHPENRRLWEKRMYQPPSLELSLSREKEW